MATGRQKPSLLVIVGPTASGKSALAHKVALEFNGEIIAADSRTIYKGMDIGTAKPSLRDRNQISYWGLDLVEPGKRFTAADFKNFAAGKITEISARDKLPIMVGGTGLYIDSVLFNLSFGPDVKKSQRSDLDKLSTEELQEIIKRRNYPMPTNYKNRRHLIRMIERVGRLGTQQNILPSTLVIGLLPADDKLRENINHRADKMFAQGVVNETKELMLKYGKGRVLATAGIAYKICARYLAGDYDLSNAKVLFKTKDWQYARRQRTWFKRNPSIIWFKNSASAYDYLGKHLNK